MMVLQGVVDRWSQKGFGFIKANDGNSYFIHWSNIIKDGYKELSPGQLVEFNGEDSPKGLVAVNLSVIDE